MEQVARQPPMPGGLPLPVHLVQVSLFCLSWSTQPTGLVNWDETSQPQHFHVVYFSRAQAEGLCADHRDPGGTIGNPSRAAPELSEGASSRWDSSEAKKSPEDV